MFTPKRFENGEACGSAVAVVVVMVMMVISVMNYAFISSTSGALFV